MCFVWISEQTAIISLYSINWLVFVTEECVYCAVRTGPLNVIQFKSNAEKVPKIPNFYFLFLIQPSRLKSSKINTLALNQKAIKFYLQIVHYYIAEKLKFRGTHYQL